MEVIGTGRHQVVDERREVVAVHALEVRAGDHAEQVRDHAVGDERLAEVVEVESPRVGRAVRDDLEDLAGRVIPPDAAIHRRPLLLRRPRLADLRGGQDAVATPEPAVGTPVQGVEHVVLSVDAPAVELDDRRAVGPVVAVAVGDEDQVGRGADPDPAEPQRDAGVVGPSVGKDGPAIEAAVAVGVLEDQDAIPAARPAQPDRVRVVLDHPEPPPVVDGHGDRLDDVGLGGGESDPEPGRHRDPLRGLRGRGRGVRRGHDRLGWGRRNTWAEYHNRRDQPDRSPSNDAALTRSHIRCLLSRAHAEGLLCRKPPDVALDRSLADFLEDQLTDRHAAIFRPSSCLRTLPAH